jgi:hypothetical protein
LQPGESTYVTHAGITWEVTRLDLARRVEDEGLDDWGMRWERDLDEADREAEQAWLEERS